MDISVMSFLNLYRPRYGSEHVPYRGLHVFTEAYTKYGGTQYTVSLENFLVKFKEGSMSLCKPKANEWFDVTNENIFQVSTLNDLKQHIGISIYELEVVSWYMLEGITEVVTENRKHGNHFPQIVLVVKNKYNQDQEKR